MQRTVDGTLKYGQRIHLNLWESVLQTLDHLGERVNSDDRGVYHPPPGYFDIISQHSPFVNRYGMTLFDEINEENFELYAARCYSNPQCMSVEEFYHDLQRFKYLKKLLNRYVSNNDLQERLILNHIVVIYNVFGIEPANKMLNYKIEDDYWPVLKPFLIYLNFIKETDYISVPLDWTIVKQLRSLH